METLRETFKKHELTYTLLKRNDVVALYGVSGTYTPDTLHFEVCRIKQTKETTIKGQMIAARETIPSDEQFGKEGSCAFPVRMKNEAYTYFDTFTDAIKAKNT